MAILKVYLFGGFRLQGNGEPLPPIPTLKGRSLFAYLSTYRGQPHTRDLLAGLFWPDLPDAQARRRLSHALWEIGRSLSALPSPQPYNLTDAGTVQFNAGAPCWLDVEAFEAKLREAESGEGVPPSRALAQLRGALMLYSGDFLAGYYDDWAVIEQERLRDLYLDALERLVSLCKSQGLYEEALGHASQLARHDPLREEAHREVMRLCFLLGRLHEALQQYNLCRHLLAEELAAEPSPATTALHREIRARMESEPARRQPTPTAPPSPLLEGAGPVPFVGRDEERRDLVRAVEGALGRRGGIVLVEGEPGVGKTRLLQEVSQDAVWRGLQVLWGRGREREELTPYGTLREALEGGLSPLRAGQLAELVEGVWLREVSQLIPQLAEWLPDLPPRVALAPQDEGRRLREAVTRVLLALEQIAPHLLILDDLQWADEGTLNILADLAPRLSERRMLAVVSFRGGEARGQALVWKALRALDQTGSRERLLLSRLSADEMAELVQRGLGLINPASRFEARLYRESGGNPLFVLETLRALHDEGLLLRDETGAWSMPWDEITADHDELPVAPALQQVIAGRLARLSPPTRVTLNAAAVLGDDFDFPLLRQVSGVEGSVALNAVDDLLRRGLLLEGKEAYQFSHEQIRRVAYEETAMSERQELHRRAGSALETAHPDRLASLALHFAQGRVWDKAVHYHQRAGERAAAVHAYPTALRHYNQAVALAEVANLSTRRHFELLAAREAALEVLGQREAQAADLAAMAQLAQGDLQHLSQVYRRRAEMLAHTGRLDEAEADAHRALALAERLRDEIGRAAALTMLGEVYNQWSKPAQAISHLEAAVEAYDAAAQHHRPYRRQDQLRWEAGARELLGTALLGLQEYAAARTELEAALALYQALDDQLGQAKVWGRLGVLHRQKGDAAAGEMAYQRALETCQSIGYRHGEARNLLNLGLLLNAQGEINRALRFFDQAVDACRAIGERRGEAIVRVNAASVRYAILGDDEAAAIDAEAALACCREIGDLSYEALLLIVLGGIAQRRGELDVARTHLETALAKLQASGHRWLIAQVHRDLAFLARDEGRPEAALECLDAAETMCQELGLAGLAVEVQALRGMMLLTLERPKEALAATGEAVARLHPGVNRAYLVHFWHSEVLRAMGRMEEAHTALEQSYQALMTSLQGLSSEQRRMSLERVPEHRAIVEAWEAAHPRRIAVRLPCADAPAGQPLHDDEWVEVTWTVETAEDEAIGGKKARRQHRLLRLLRESEEHRAAPRIVDLATALEVNPRTIKRDLAALRETGHQALAVRTRGSRP